MDLKLTTGPMVKALGDFLLYWDQHDPSHISTTKLCLAWIQEDPVPFYPGYSTIVLEADESIPLVEERPSSARIQQYKNDRDRAVRTPNSHSTNPRWNWTNKGQGTPNMYFMDLDPLTLSSFSDSINVYKQLVTLGVINKATEEDEPHDEILQSHVEKGNSFISTQGSMPPLEPYKDAQTISSTSKPDTPLSNMALPLPPLLHLPLKQVVFYELDKHSIIGKGPKPWRIICHNLGGDKVLVHAEDFLAEFNHTRLEMVLWLAMPTTLEVKLQHMHLYLKNTIAFYANVKCTCISKTHGTFYNKSYVWAIDLIVQDALKWNILHKHTLHETINAAVIFLKWAEDNSKWGTHYISNYEVLPKTLISDATNLHQGMTNLL